MYRHLLLGSAALKVLHRSKMAVLVHKSARCRTQVRGRMTPEKNHPGKPGQPFWFRPHSFCSRSSLQHNACRPWHTVTSTNCCMPAR